MTDARMPKFVGAPDPELKNSPIVDENDDSYEVIEPMSGEFPVCYFNNIAYDNKTYVCSGSGELLRCEKGVWVREGTCDPDNL